MEKNIIKILFKISAFRFMPNRILPIQSEFLCIGLAPDHIGVVLFIKFANIILELL